MAAPEHTRSSPWWRRLFGGADPYALEPYWWVFVAAGLVLLAVSGAAMSSLGNQLGFMHLPGKEGFRVQGFSLSHLKDAVDAWRGYTPTANSLHLATPRGVAVTWAAVDLFLFIPGYALAGATLLWRGAERRSKTRLGPLLRGAALLLVAVVVLDVVENTLTLGALWQ